MRHHLHFEHLPGILLTEGKSNSNAILTACMARAVMLSVIFGAGVTRRSSVSHCQRFGAERCGDRVRVFLRLDEDVFRQQR